MENGKLFPILCVCFAFIMIETPTGRCLEEGGVWGGGLKRNITFWVHCVKQQLPSIHYYYHFTCFVVVVSTVVIVLYHNMSLCRAHVLIILNSYQTKTSLDSVEYIRKNTDKRFRILGCCCCCCFCFIACHNQDMWNKISDSLENIKYLFW